MINHEILSERFILFTIVPSGLSSSKKLSKDTIPHHRHQTHFLLARGESCTQTLKSSD